MSARVFVFGNATLDIVQSVARLPAPGETLLAHSLERCAGGKGLNQAVACARAGARTVLVAPIGDDADGRQLREAALPEMGLESRWMDVPYPTDLSSIWVSDDGENVIVSSAAAARSLRERDVAAMLPDLRARDLLVMQGNLPAEVTRAAVELGRERDALTLLNTAPIDWPMGDLLPRVDIVVANVPEAERLTGFAPEQAACALLRGATRAAVVTEGEAGALLATGGELRRVPAPAVRAVDTSGAGDVAVGTLAAFLAAGQPVEAALQGAMAAAALSVTRRGTTPSFPTRAEIAAIAARLAP